MGRLTHKEELFNLAYRLAFFVHRDKVIAIKIATEAMLMLDVVSAKQAKRYYYQPLAGRLRSKVFLNDANLLQRMVYRCSEYYEKKQEERGGVTELDEEDLLIRYVGYLARITLKRNSFYVALGMCRFIYKYQFAETRSLYEFLVQDANRFKEDNYYRQCKRKLKKEISGRFVNFLRVAKGSRGEEYFEIEEQPDRHANFLVDCLKVCTPWRTECVLPAHFDPRSDLISKLSFKGTDPDREHPIEMNRIHSLFHPRCFSRLIESFDFDVPFKRLAVPHFNLSKDNGEGGPKGGRHNPPPLGREDIENLNRALEEEEAARRRWSSNGRLSVKVDGVERAHFAPSVENKVCVEIEEGDELIEVVNVQGGREVTLAACLLSFAEIHNNGGALTSTVILEGGQRLRFTILLADRPDSEEEAALVHIAYEENYLRRAASNILNRGSLIFEQCPRLTLPHALAPIAIIGISLFLVFGLLRMPGYGAAPVSQCVQFETQQNDTEKAIESRKKNIECRVDAIARRMEADSRILKHTPYDLNVSGRLNYASLYADKRSLLE